MRTDIVYSQIHVDRSHPLVMPTALPSKPVGNVRVDERYIPFVRRNRCDWSTSRSAATRIENLSLFWLDRIGAIFQRILSLSRGERQTWGSSSVKLVFKSYLCSYIRCTVTWRSDYHAILYSMSVSQLRWASRRIFNRTSPTFPTHVNIPMYNLILSKKLRILDRFFSFHC